MSHRAHSRKPNKLATEASGLLYLDNEGTKDNTTEDKVVEDAFKDIPFAVDLAGIDLVEKLHHHKGIEDNGVVFRRWGVEGCIPAVVNVKQFLSYGNSQRGFVKLNGWIYPGNSQKVQKVLCVHETTPSIASYQQRAE